MNDRIIVLSACLLLVGAWPFDSRADESSSHSTAQSAGAASRLTFTLSGGRYVFSIPDGSCKTEGADAELADATASLDSLNMTHFTLIPCADAGRGNEFTRWGMLKTPRNSLGKRVPSREKWVSDAQRSIKHNEFQELFSDPSALATKKYREIFGDKVQLGSHMEMVDTDSFAAYMSGTISLSAGGETTFIAAAGAMTVVRENVFFYYRYGPYRDASDLGKVMKEAKADIRVFVKENDG